MARVRPRLTRLIVVVAAAGLCLPLTALPPDAQPVDLTDEVQATYLYKLPNFVTRPLGSLLPGRFVICVVERSRITAPLEDTPRADAVQQRRAIIRRYFNIVGNPGWQVLFAAGSDAQPVAAILSTVRGQPMLTVADHVAER